MESNIEIMDDIMDAIMQTDAWQDAQNNNEIIMIAQQRLLEVIAKVEKYLPRELQGELEDAICAQDAAYSEAGVLFGIHAAEAIRTVSANPEQLFKHMAASMRTAG